MGLLIEMTPATTKCFFGLELANALSRRSWTLPTSITMCRIVQDCRSRMNDHGLLNTRETMCFFGVFSTSLLSLFELTKTALLPFSLVWTHWRLLRSSAAGRVYRRFRAHTP